MPDSLIQWWPHSSLTLIQAQALPVILAGHDVLGTAVTGSGKSLAYLIPMALHVVENTVTAGDAPSSRGLVLVPTRELALQVVRVAKSMCKAIDSKILKPLAVIGGNQGRYQLIQDMKKIQPTIVAATPGRLLDVAGKSNKRDAAVFDFSQVTMVVLDEADKMLHMGFAAQVTEVLQQLRPDRQTIMFSATMTRKLENLANQKWFSSSFASSVRISVGRIGASTENVEQHVVVLPNDQAKIQFVTKLLPDLIQVGRVL